MIKLMGYCIAFYTMELINVQTRLKGQDSPQLCLEIRKKD